MHGTQSIVFPGQGSQETHMGRDLAEHWSDAMDYILFLKNYL